MTLNELAAASRMAGQAVEEYQARWNAWKASSLTEIRGQQSLLGKLMARYQKLQEELRVFGDLVQKQAKMIDEMRAPPVIDPVNSVTSLKITGELVGVPPELRPLVPLLQMFVSPRLAPGIYFLVKGASVVYVGQSVDAVSRVAQHRRDGKDFDRVFFLEVVDVSSLTRVEEAFIRILAPSLNVTAKEEPSESDHRLVASIAARCG